MSYQQRRRVFCNNILHNVTMCFKAQQTTILYPKGTAMCFSLLPSIAQSTSQCYDVLKLLRCIVDRYANYHNALRALLDRVAMYCNLQHILLRTTRCYVTSLPRVALSRIVLHSTKRHQTLDDDVLPWTTHAHCHALPETRNIDSEIPWSVGAKAQTLATSHWGHFACIKHHPLNIERSKITFVRSNMSTRTGIGIDTANSRTCCSSSSSSSTSASTSASSSTSTSGEATIWCLVYVALVLVLVLIWVLVLVPLLAFALAPTLIARLAT